jgi:hypothetical protein
MTSPPNILFLLNDHQTYYGHGEMSGGPKIQRPNFIDEKVSYVKLMDIIGKHT